MSVPNELELVRKLFNTGVFNLKTHEGQGAFTDAVVSALHAKDPRWGHLKKSAAQTNEHGHAEDAALYLSDTDGESTAVDFIGGAGGSNPQPAWQVDDPRYSAKDWADPTDHGFSKPPAPAPLPVIPGYEQIGGDAFARSEIGVPLQADMAQVGQHLNDGSSIWFYRAAYDVIAEVIKNPNVDKSAIVKKHRNLWRAVVGLPPL